MSKLIATLVATLFAATAFAQVTNGTHAMPPEVPAAGTTESTTFVHKDGTPVTSNKPVTEAKAKRIAKSKVRKAKRDAKVGEVPLN